MLELFTDIFEYDFLLNAFVACLLSGVTCGVVGSYIVARRMVFLCGGITHASFGGLGVALYMGVNPIFGAMLFASFSSLGIEFASRKGRIREDSAIGIIWSVGMAVGALFMSLREGYSTDLTSYLFGNILLVDSIDIQLLSILTLLIVVGSVLWLRRLMFVTFDEAYARSQGVPVSLLSYLMSVVVAVTIVLSIKIMGIVLLLSLLTIPPVISNSITKDYRLIAPMSAIVAVLGNLFGFMVSYQYDIPTGSCIIFVLATTLICVKLITLFNNRRCCR